MLLTNSHITFIVSNGKMIPTYAKDLQLGDKLMTWTGEKFKESEVSSSKQVWSEGYRTPLTEEGTLLGNYSAISLKSNRNINS